MARRLKQEIPQRRCLLRRARHEACEAGAVQARRTLRDRGPLPERVSRGQLARAVRLREGVFPGQLAKIGIEARDLFEPPWAGEAGLQVILDFDPYPGLRGENIRKILSHP